MGSCAYCDKVATENIPSDSGRVCVTHAMEFWTGLLTYAREHSELSEPLKAQATCAVCEELSAARARTMAAVEAAGLPPRIAPAPLRLASPRRTSNVTRISTSVWGGMSRPMSR